MLSLIVTFLVNEEIDEVDENEYLISDDDDEQFACTICRQPFQNAVKTM